MHAGIRAWWPRPVKVYPTLLLACTTLLVTGTLLLVAQRHPGAGYASSALSGGDDWPTYLHDSVRSGASAESLLSTANAGQLAPLWSYQTGDTIAAQAAVVNGVVYIGSWDGYEYALNAATGALLWKTFLGQTFPSTSCSPSHAGITSSAAVQNGVVYVGGGDSYWYALDATTGNVLWKVYTGDNSATGGHYNWSSPLLYNGYAYIGIASYGDCPLVQGQLVQVDLSTQQVVNTLNFAPSGHVGGGIWTSPSVDATTNTIYVTTGTLAGGTTYPLPQAMVGVDATSLQVLSSWQIPAAQAVTDSDWGTTPLLYTDASGTNWVAGVNKNGILYAFHRAAVGAGPTWQYQLSVGGECALCGQGTVSSGALGGGRIYFAGGQTTINGTSVPGSVQAFDPATGKVLWQHATSAPVVPAITYDNGLLFVCGGKVFEVLDASTGTRLYSNTAGGTFYGAPSISNGFVYAGATDGKLYAFGLSSAATGLQLNNLQVSDTTNATNWTLQTNLQVGNVQYGDRGYTLTSIPSSLSGAAWIRTANSSKSYTGTPLATFSINQPANVYVALDSREAVPSWMGAGWANTGFMLTDNQAAGTNTFVLYTAPFAPGTVSLGPNGGGTGVNMYTVVVAPSGTATPTTTSSPNATATSTATAIPSSTPSPTATATPPPTGTPSSGPVQLSNLVVADTTNASYWSLQTNLQVGAVQYGDRGYTFSSVPAGLLGATWIRSANASRVYTGTPTVSFTINQQATIYVAFDSRLTPPNWIDATWTNSGLALTDNQSVGYNSFVLYAKSFPAGSVALGPNDNGSTSVNMYTVIVLGSGGSSPTPTASGVAQVVYAQPDFVTSTLYATGQNALKNPSQLIADGTGGVYVVDYGNSRVLHFPAFAGVGAGPPADQVYGQPDFTSSTASSGAGHLNYPHGVAWDPAGGLYISDMYNNRVLHYPAGSTSADRVYGQPDFAHSVANNGGISATSLNLPQGISVDRQGGLYIADSGNNRVLHYPAGSGTADFVYGQPNFSSNAAAAGANGLYTPRDVKIESAGLFVADSGNQRVLQYTPGNGAASRVYGQLTFTATAANQGSGPTASTLNNPTGIAFDGIGGLYIGDRNNERVLFFPPPVQTAIGNDPTATIVYGQTGFTTNGIGTTASGFNGPGATSVDGMGHLFVLDIFNQRVLMFQSAE
jgi:outer membrane protein assembly factor BamB